MSYLIILIVNNNTIKI